MRGICMQVLKFGGSSVADAERIADATRIVARGREQATITVVVSAMAGVTDALLRIARSALRGEDGWCDELGTVRERHHTTYLTIAGRVSPRFERLWSACEADVTSLARAHGGEQPALADAVVSAVTSAFSGWGERLMVDLFAEALSQAGTRAEGFPEEPVLLDGMVLDAAEPAGYRPRPSSLATRAWLVPRLAGLLLRSGVPVLPGYIARDAAGHVTTLGRNGSDHSAAVVAAALGAEALCIYSDVAGIYSADPRVVSDAELLPVVTYTEAAEVALRGARVLHPHTVEPLASWRIPLHLRSSLRPDLPGTEVVPDAGAVSEWAETGDGTRQQRVRWVVAARPLPTASEGAGSIACTGDGSLAEVSVTLIGRSWSSDAHETALVAAGARALLECGLAPQELAFSARHLRCVVPVREALDAQRRLHAALVREVGNSRRPARDDTPEAGRTVLQAAG